jgi:hypothetical protein
MLERLYAVLTDFDFLQAKLGALPGQDPQQPPATVFDLLQDFVEALSAWPAGDPRREGVEALYRIIDGNSYFLKDAPRLLLQQVYNAGAWTTAGLGARVLEAERRCAWPLLRLRDRPEAQERCALLPRSDGAHGLGAVRGVVAGRAGAGQRRRRRHGAAVGPHHRRTAPGP